MLSRIYIYKNKERNKKIKLMKSKKDKKKKEMEQKETYIITCAISSKNEQNIPMIKYRIY